MSSKQVKKKKLPSLSKLTKAAHALWSQLVRFRDKVCQVCGTAEKLQAHHCIVPKGRGGSIRFMLDNGICLCDKCHLWTYHEGRGGVAFDRKLLAAIDAHVTLQRQEELTSLAQKHRFKRDELNYLIFALTAQLNKLKELP